MKNKITFLTCSDCNNIPYGYYSTTVDVFCIKENGGTELRIKFSRVSELNEIMKTDFLNEASVPIEYAQEYIRKYVNACNEFTKFINKRDAEIVKFCNRFNEVKNIDT